MFARVGVATIALPIPIPCDPNPILIAAPGIPASVETGWALNGTETNARMNKRKYFIG
jgi:hypothetical protein